MTCDAFRTLVLGGQDARGAAAQAHEAECADCRLWLARFVEGGSIWEADPPARLTADVLAASADAACGRARAHLTGERDEPLPAFDRGLVDAHLERCHTCRAFASELDATLAALPALARLDPGPGFAERVWARTSRRPAAARWADWARALWAGWLARPRFAWEAAYVATVCWVLAFGGPITAWEWSRSTVATIAERPLPEKMVEWRSRMPRFDTARVAEAVPSVDAVETVASRLAGRIATLWRDGAAWVRHLSDRLYAAAGVAWQRAVEWFDQLRGQRRGAPTEPGAGPVRST